MSRGFFPRLAASNIRKNGKTYFPYMLTGILTVAVFYMVKSLSQNPGLEQMVGAATLAFTLSLGSWLVGLFALIFLFYTNSFLIKRRKREFAIFQILGMEKRHLARTLAWETFYMAAVSLAGGLVLGMSLDKLMYLAITRMIDGPVSLGFFVSGQALAVTALLFLAIFLLIFLNTVRQIQVANPMELLRESQAGEREPRSRWLTALVGLACVGTGYYLAITTENPMTSMLLFFVAVVLVVIGTYLLFTAGITVFLKLLRKNKRYYYQPRHFVSVSGLIYRMRRNAVGLANICVLSTMVLVMISATSSLMLGMEDIIHSRYPYHFAVYTEGMTPEEGEALADRVRELQRQQELPVTGEIQYAYLAFSCLEDGDTFLVTREVSMMVLDDVANLFFVSLDDFNRGMGTDWTLEEGEVLLYANRKDYRYPELRLFDKTYTVKAQLDSFLGNGITAANAASSYFLVVRDWQEVQELYEQQKAVLGDIASQCQYYYGFDTSAGEEEQRAFFQAFNNWRAENQILGIVESSVDARTSFLGLYGGFFFLGVFLGVLFLAATVLIIYYKQISEGYEDQERFSILQKVGMSRREVKASIRSQVLLVFFLPLAVAGAHTAAALPMVMRMLALLNLTNQRLYVACSAVCFLVFGVLYVLVYRLTARTYYRIVRR